MREKQRMREIKKSVNGLRERERERERKKERERERRVKEREKEGEGEVDKWQVGWVSTTFSSFCVFSIEPKSLGYPTTTPLPL